MQPAAEIFEIRISVMPEDIDVMNHVNNVAYLRWVQEVAVAHWRTAATAAEQQQWLWVVLRHEIDYKQPAVLGDEIVARTWVGNASRVKFERNTEILRAGEGTLLAKAVSWWCSIDALTRRPSAASEELRRRFGLAEKNSAG
jgi:acyl-CoA thioester hydrolase